MVDSLESDPRRHAGDRYEDFTPKASRTSPDYPLMVHLWLHPPESGARPLPLDIFAELCSDYGRGEQTDRTFLIQHATR